MSALSRLVLLLSFLLPLVRADIDFTQPAAGDVITGTSLVATWVESGQQPPISTLQSYSLFLCAGGNNDTEFINLFNLQPYAIYGEGNKWTGAISPGWGGNSTDAYFLLMISTSACGGTIKNYSNRFTISSMTGSFPPNVVQGIQTLGTTTDGPPNNQSDAGPALECTSRVAPEPATTASTAAVTVLASASMTDVVVLPTSTDTSALNISSSKSVTLSTGVLAGIIITSMLIFASICGVAVYVFLRLRKRRLQPQSPKTSFKLWSARTKEMERLYSTDNVAELAEGAICKEMEADKRQPTELSTLVRAELPARRSIYELPGS